MILEKKSLHLIQNWIEIALTDGAIALIDKDKDWTSFDVVAKLRNVFRIRKIGHTGTLDPLATGLLILCFGKLTKTIDSYLGLNKSYAAVIKLGAKTISDDAETEETDFKTLDNLLESDIISTINSFLGDIEQTPPDFSAKWINGRRSYILARKKVKIENKAQIVTIHKININKIELPYIEVDFECSKGTYIRALARDIGSKLGCGAYLYNLRRTKIGDYSIDNALKISEIEQQICFNNSML